MNIAIIGGGPAGLYFSILHKLARPGASITVFERNRPGDTFGFGVVFSDQTLDNLEAADPVSFKAITDEFAYWDDIEIRHKGHAFRISGNGFCGFARSTLLDILAKRAESLGVELRFGTEVESVEALMESHDLVVLGDGINSATRDGFAEHFQPVVDLRPNKFVWMGSECPLDAFTFAFEETPHGVFHRPRLPVRRGPLDLDLRMHRRDVPQGGGSTGCRRRSPPAAWRRCSPPISTGIPSSPTARSGATSRWCATRAG